MTTPDPYAALAKIQAERERDRDPARRAEAVAARRADLVAEAADKPAHTRYLTALLDAGSGEAANEVEPGPGVSGRAADALLTDVWWLYDQPRRSPFPGEYRRFRASARRGAATRKRNRDRQPPKAVTELRAILTR